MNVPDADLFDAAVVLVCVGVGVAAGVSAAGVCACPAFEFAAFVAAADFVGCALELADLLAFAFALFVAAAVALGDDDVLAAAAGVVSLPGRAIGELCVEVNCGGVTANTAPSPPTVPVAINNARFISVPSRSYL